VYLAAITDLREGVQWLSYGGRQPLYEYLTAVDSLFQQLETRIDEEIPKRLVEAQEQSADPSQRGTTWTYLTTDQPFGSWSERVMRGVVRRYRRRT
jgi:preprotein translocase subunit SecA